MSPRDARPCIRCGNTTEPILVPCETPQCEDSVACAARAKSSSLEPTTEPGRKDPNWLEPGGDKSATEPLGPATIRVCGWCGALPWRESDMVENPDGPGWECVGWKTCTDRVLNGHFGPLNIVNEDDRARYAVAQSAPRNLTPDPKDGTRAGWDWCASCAGIREPAHTCYPRKRRADPMTDEQAEFERMAAGHG